MGSGEGNAPSPSLFQVMEMETPPLVPLDEDINKYCPVRSASPEPQFECEGWCRDKMQRKGSLPHADVISISSSNDGQSSWDASTPSGDSISMTNSLIKILSDEKRPQITYSRLMILLNHEVYSFTMRMHKINREKSHARRMANGNFVDYGPDDEDRDEMDNFQDLQLGSRTPLDMGRIFIL